MSLISIIIPCYNYGKYLPFTLDSLIAQTYQHWECLIVNDGSLDNTEEVAKEYTNRDNRVKYLYQKNKGISAARNAGIQESKGEFIQLIDADDLIEHRKLEEQIKIFAENPNFDIVYSSVRFFRTDFPEERLYSLGRVNKYWMPNVTGSGNKVIKFLVQDNIVATNCPLFRRSVFDRAGLFNENLRVLEDWDFWLRCALNNLYFFFLDKPDTLALVRVHNKSVSNNTWDMRYMELRMKQDLQNKITDPDLKQILHEQVENVKKVLVGISVYELLKGNANSFLEKLKLITGKDTLGAATLQVIQNKYFPEVSIGKMFFYGKKLLFNSK